MPYKDKNKKLEIQRRYRKTPIGRAISLLASYNRQDAEMGREKGDLTAQWIVDNIFSQPCTHCSKTGWDVMGCNRLDNSKPHTMDNVEPCCRECNLDLAGYGARQIDQISPSDGEVVRTWKSVSEAGRNGFDIGHVSECCSGKRSTHKDWIWRRVI